AAAEALVRWQHPVRGLLEPSEFVPVAEETGLIRALDHHVLRQACAQARRWSESEPTGLQPRVHVNLSVAELRDADLVPGILATLEEFQLAPQQLALEVTETQLLGDAAATATRFEELRAHGVRIALDDFGTGYSSLSYLH